MHTPPRRDSIQHTTPRTAKPLLLSISGQHHWSSNPVTLVSPLPSRDPILPHGSEQMRLRELHRQLPPESSGLHPHRRLT